MNRAALMRALAAALLTSAALPCASCKKPSDAQTDDSASKPKPAALPPLEVKADSPNLLLTWIDDKGDFHVVQKPADVPPGSRAQVRVVVTTREEGTGALVYVANLDVTKPDGSYRLKTMTRAQWDELGASKRKERMEALAPSALPSGAPAPGAPATGSKPAAAAPGARPPASGVVAIIYGAEWCKPCHEAERYLKQRGATVIKKNIDDNEVAAAEMRQKLARVGRSDGSIPVIDIMGQIMVGFSPAALEQALAHAQSAKGI